ncbi:MFS transporter [Parabacteroides johnsonii]|jgi:FHS family L-fucose permease-like MFS transporter|uniref:MFS transporter n=2 Tax=Parabacteroides johnsonii TaxID=387661 RepID=A0A9Q5SQU0_9BACT|nr:MFS transporter [Parabacteroides johnsonii]OUO04690.1 MFS transporter [Parabacteroides johnsonii]UEA91573.1 MFS transporter [Parabacteroides johnsonii]UWP43726.1 MFS transporter [Parabacteroides johnsonii DSM 18315]
MESTKQKNYVLPIAMMFALFAMISFVTGLPQPFGAIVQNEFGASNFEATLGFFANFIAYAFMGIPAGMLLQKIGYKKTALIAIVVGFVGVGIQVLSSKMGFATYVAGAFVSGFSMCMLNTVVNPMLNTLGGGGKKGNQLIQMGGSLNSVSATIVPVLVGYLMGTVVEERTIAKALPALYIAMAIFAVAFLVLFIMNIPEPSLAKANNNAKNEHSPLAFRHFKLGALAIFVYVGIEVGIPHFAGLFMMTPEAGGGLAIDSTIAGSVVGTYWFLMLIGRLVGASLGGKFTSKAMLTVASGVGILFIILAFICPITTMVSMPVFKSDISFGVAQVPISIMFMALCGLCTSIMWGGIFNLAVEGLGKYTEAASGIFMVLVCGGGILPLIQGQIADMSGFMTSYVVILIALAYLLFYALVGCKNVNKNIPVE